jgi:hypothetical protein
MGGVKGNLIGKDMSLIFSQQMHVANFDSLQPLRFRLCQAFRDMVF